MSPLGGNQGWTIEQVTDGRGRRYEILNEAGEKQTLPSVTTILGALPKGGLEWWGFKLGLQAATEMVFKSPTREGVLDDELDAVYALAKQTKYAPHRALKAAGSRGTDVHAVMEDLLRTGKLTDLPAGTTAEDGFIDALVKWHTDLGVDQWEMVAVEELLFSATHRYAGQTDFIAKRPDGVYVVGDLKTSKAVYESHLIQAAAYEGAAIEMGLIPADAVVEKHVVRVSPDGEYEVVRSQHTVEDFLAVKAVFELLKDRSKKGVAV